MKKVTTVKKAQIGGAKTSYKTTNEIYTNALNGKDRTYEKKQVLQKGDKTVVNKKSFTKLASGSKFPTAKSTTVYDKKTGVTKKAGNKPSITGFGKSEGSVKYTTAKTKPLKKAQEGIAQDTSAVKPATNQMYDKQQMAKDQYNAALKKSKENLSKEIKNNSDALMKKAKSTTPMMDSMYSKKKGGSVKKK